MSDYFLFLLFKLMKLKLSAEQKTVKLLWVAYLSCLWEFSGLRTVHTFKF